MEKYGKVFASKYSAPWPYEYWELAFRIFVTLKRVITILEWNVWKNWKWGLDCKRLNQSDDNYAFFELHETEMRTFMEGAWEPVSWKSKNYWWVKVKGSHPNRCHINLRILVCKFRKRRWEVLEWNIQNSCLSLNFGCVNKWSCKFCICVSNKKYIPFVFQRVWVNIRELFTVRDPWLNTWFRIFFITLIQTLGIKTGK